MVRFGRTAKAGLDKPDPEYGPLWSVGAVWVDVNNDGLLDLRTRRTRSVERYAIVNRSNM
jgi:hypothetical protein